ncbi:restriction endonuclease subunit S [Bacillus tropicus]|uniref:restriction endonuclease subunit S n=1 Tax=Bacillus tropicus TaxID=2026188 RepID=UPI003D1C6EDA
MNSNSWKVKKWGDLVELKYGKSLKNYKEKTVGYRVFGTNGPIGYNEEALCEQETVIVGRKGAYRGVHYSDKPCYVIDTAFYTVPIEEINMKWAFYELLTKNINNLDSGSAIPSTSREDFYSLKSKVPPIGVQNKIVNILSIFEEKIELNSKMISNLEQLSQTLFKHWFIDFEFPNEKGQPYKSSGGEMVESELGEIPKGWSVKSLDEVANYQNGLAMQKYRPQTDEEKFLPVLKIRELNRGFTDVNSDKCSINIKDSVKIYDGDVIFSWSGTLLVKLWTGGRAGLNQHLFKVTSDEFSKWFYYLWTKHHLRVFQARAAEKATTMGHIKRAHLQEAKVLTPSHNMFNEANKTFEPIINQIITLGIENKKLEELRDTLLLKLLSGEIEIPDELVVD